MDTKKQNGLAGKHPSYDKAGMSPSSRKRKLAYDKQYESSPARIKYRESLNEANRKAQKAGRTKVGDGKDMSHTTKGTMVKESQSANRARNGMGKNGTRINTKKKI
jgi:hypothetical protein